MSGIGGIKFRPVMGTENAIKNTEQSNGWLYVATDSGNMYLDIEDRRIRVGGSGGSGDSGSTGFVWADGGEEAETIVKATDDASDGDTTYYFALSAIDASAVPKVDTLILNSDGRFFRVTDTSAPLSGMITVELIAVSGSGGGGGTSVADLRLSWKGIDSLGTTYVYGQSTEIQFYPESDADDVCSVLVTVEDVEGNQIALSQGRTRNKNAFVFNTKTLPINANLTLYITIKSDSSTYNNGKGLKKSFPIKIVDMHLEK